MYVTYAKYSHVVGTETYEHEVVWCGIHRQWTIEEAQEHLAQTFDIPTHTVKVHRVRTLPTDGDVYFL